MSYCTRSFMLRKENPMPRDLDDIYNVLVDIKTAVVSLLNVKMEIERLRTEAMQLTDPSPQDPEQSGPPKE